MCERESVLSVCLSAAVLTPTAPSRLKFGVVRERACVCVHVCVCV